MVSGAEEEEEVDAGAGAEARLPFFDLSICSMISLCCAIAASDMSREDVSSSTRVEDWCNAWCTTGSGGREAREGYDVACMGSVLILPRNCSKVGGGGSAVVVVVRGEAACV